MRPASHTGSDRVNGHHEVADMSKHPSIREFKGFRWSGVPRRRQGLFGRAWPEPGARCEIATQRSEIATQRSEIATQRDLVGELARLRNPWGAPCLGQKPQRVRHF